MKNISSKKYILKKTTADGKNIMYFKSRIDKGMFHYVFSSNEAAKLTKEEINKLISETKYKERYEILEVNENGK